MTLDVAEWCAQRREWLGRIVREVWVEWAREQPDPKPSWLQRWDDLTEPEREVDRRIGERVALNALATHGRISHGGRMKIDAAHNLKPGIYRVFWTDGGASLAAVGVGSNGENWLAPINWVEPATSAQACHPAHPEHWSWATVERVELLLSSADAEPPDATGAAAQ